MRETRRLSVDVFGMGDTTKSGYTPAGKAPRDLGARKPQNHNKLETTKMQMIPKNKGNFRA